VDEAHSLSNQTQQDQTSIKQLIEQLAQLQEIQNLNTELPTGAVAAATQTLLKAQQKFGRQDMKTCRLTRNSSCNE